MHGDPAACYLPDRLPVKHHNLDDWVNRLPAILWSRHGELDGA